MDTHDQREYAHCHCSGEADEHYKPIIAGLEAERDQIRALLEETRINREFWRTQAQDYQARFSRAIAELEGKP